MRRTSRYFSLKSQKGAAAIEFALVFLIFFAVLYGLMSYCLPFLMVQSFNAAAAEAVRQSVAISPSAANYTTLVKTQAQASLVRQLTWIPASLNFNALDSSDATVTVSNTGLLTVSIHYSRDKLTRVLPVIVVPGIGSVPNLPSALSAQASLQLAP